MLTMNGSPVFECTVEGSALLKPAFAAEAVCAHIAERTATARAGAGPIRVAVRFTRAGIASAKVTRTANGKAEEMPDISIATSDKAMGQHTIDMLADEIARALVPR